MNKIQEFQTSFVELLQEREHGEIKRGNTIIKSKLGIFNFPRGFGRKTILSKHIYATNLPDWERKKTIDFRFIENFYFNSQIIREKNITCKKSNFTLLVCSESSVDNWITILKNESLEYYHYNKKHHFTLDLNLHRVIIVSPKHACFFLSMFQRISFKRVFLFDPELLTIENFPTIFYGFCWIVTAEPDFITTLDKSHFIFRFLPQTIDRPVFNVIQICKDLKIKETLKKLFQLPDYKLWKHSFQADMSMILQGLDDELFDLINKGEIRLLLNKVNALSGSSNITDYVLEKIDNEIKQIKSEMEENKDNKRKIHEKKIQDLKVKKTQFETQIKNYWESQDCVICQDKMKQPILLYCCQNLICWCCIKKWLETNTNCPYCRLTIQNSDVIAFDSNKGLTLTTNSSSIQKEKPLLTKIDKVFSLIEEIQGKIVFFSSEAVIQQSFISYCLHHKIPFQEWPEMDFEKPVKVILLTDYHDILGSTFTNIHHFISYSYLPKHIYRHICSCFYRIGRKETFHFHSFLSNEIPK